MALSKHRVGSLHIAAKAGNVELVRFLLQRENHDPNFYDHTGRSPLFAACQSRPASVEVVRLLLEAGADPSSTDEHGAIPLHLMVMREHLDLVDVLYAAAPTTLNHTATKGQTALYVACTKGSESMVSKLLSLGAKEPTPRPFRGPCPLAEAVKYGFLDVVRVLTSERGLRAVGGEGALPKALHHAVINTRAKILRLLLAVCGENRRSEWANKVVDGRALLYLGAGLCSAAEVSILLDSGADETAEDSDGFTARDVVGHGIISKDPSKAVAIRRMLDRAPAYRARTWVWPLDERTGVGDSVCVADQIAAAAVPAGTSSTTAAAVPAGTSATTASAVAATLPSAAYLMIPHSICFQVIRPKDKMSMRKYFVSVITR